MLNKPNLIIFIIIIMFSFFNKTEAKYEKLFFDLNIKNINGDVMDLNLLRNQTIILTSAVKV